MKAFFILRSIRAKLLVAVFMILSSGVAGVLFLSTRMHLKSSEAHVRKNAVDISHSYRSLIRQLVQQSEDRARSWLANHTNKDALMKFLSLDSTLRGIQVFRARDYKLEVGAFQKDWEVRASDNEISQAFQSLSKDRQQLYSEVFARDGRKLHRVISPLTQDSAGHLVLALVFYIDPAVFLSSLAQESVSHVLIFKSDGSLLFQSPGVSTSDLLVDARVPRKMLQIFSTKTVNNLQSEVDSLTGESFIGSVYKTGVDDLAVAVLTSELHIKREPRETALQSLLLGLCILFSAFIFVILFSDSLVNPIKALVEVSRTLAKGDFTVRSRVKTHDEISLLSRSFNEMARGLEERERIKEVFGKFHSKAVLEKLLSDQKIRLGGDRLPVTVFFSDIRGFTASSEILSPEAVVEMLNEYLTEMVSVIESYGGVVDKYVGDAIMAVWGLPQPDPHYDANQALRASLEMREKLIELNQRRTQRGLSALKIGIGLNSGDVIAGNIGSQSRMEYTVIGDTVNTASRMENATKELTTDLLINESTAKLLEPGVFDLEGPFQVEAKGKTESVNVYKVRGLLPESSRQVS